MAVREAVDRLAHECDGPDALREAGVELLAGSLAEGRRRVREAFLRRPAAGLRAARSYTHVADCIVAGAVHLATVHLHPAPVRTRGEQLSVLAVGGYGRGEMAPFSDVDLMFLVPYKDTPWTDSVVETVVRILFDLKLTVGSSLRRIGECLRLARADMTIRTSVLEMRFICGDHAPFEELEPRLWQELFLKTGPAFVEAKMAERDERHEKHGGSRYLLEPNVKQSKGGLRDLQTLHWISRYLYRTRSAWELVEMGVFEHDEVQRFADAAKFLWAVRCHLHDIVGRAQEQLTFDRQVEVAARMGYRDHDGRKGVEHFMHTYFRHAQAVGNLTRIFSAALEAQHAKPAPALSLLLQALNFRSPRTGAGEPFVVRGGRLTVRDESVFREDPLNLLRLFHTAARLDASVHPAALRLVTQSLDLIDDDFRDSGQASALFLEMLCDRRHGERTLRLLNETEVLGRFIPEFGRIVAMMQFNMYHRYTVDEHTILAIGVLNRIERMEEQEAHPVASELIKADINRRVLYVALLLHDIGKGDTRDHSAVGAEIAARLCPRLGLSEGETETVVWLVLNHLLMSDAAQKRDITEPRTISAFAAEVQSPQRLRLLLVLTVCDIRAVGPGVWNNWKAQLLRELYWDTRDVLTNAGSVGRTDRIRAAQEAFAAAVHDWADERREAEIARYYPHYWLGLDTDTHVIFAEMAREAEGQGSPNGHPVVTRFLPDARRDATKACLYMADHPGLFSRMAGAIALSGANVVDARSYTTSDGIATATFWIQDRTGHPFPADRLPRLRRRIELAISNRLAPKAELRQRDRPRRRVRDFEVRTRVDFDNEASDICTVIEVNARDRPGLLYDLTVTLAELRVNIFTAVIATYGAHAVDVFYCKDLGGLKIRSASARDLIRRRLIDAAEAPDSPSADDGEGDRRAATS